jgi:hypothetical protein
MDHDVTCHCSKKIPRNHETTVPIKSTLTQHSPASPRLKPFIGVIAGGIVDKIIHITADVQEGCLQEIWMSANEEARCMGALLFESHVDEEMFLEVAKPVSR